MASRVCIFGLGNPGARYSGTRHNIGFDWVDFLAKSLNANPWKEKFDSEWTQFSFQEFDIHLLKPQTFMNESGRAYASWRNRHQGEHRLLVVYDDLDLAVGSLRLRFKGSDGGHRGMKSIIEYYGSSDVARLRIGIGRPPEGAIDYVLSRFTPEQKTALNPLIADAPKHLEIFLNHDAEKAMSLMNALKYGELANGS